MFRRDFGRKSWSVFLALGLRLSCAAQSEEILPIKVDFQVVSGKLRMTFNTEAGCYYGVVGSTNFNPAWRLWPSIKNAEFLQPPVSSLEIPLPTNGTFFVLPWGRRHTGPGEIYDGGDVILENGRSNSLYRMIAEFAIATSFSEDVNYFKAGSDLLYKFKPIDESKGYYRWTYAVASNHVARVEQHQRILRELKSVPEVQFSFPMYGSVNPSRNPTAAISDEIFVPTGCSIPDPLADEVEDLGPLGSAGRLMRIRDPKNVDPLQFCLDVFQLNETCGSVVPKFYDYGQGVP